MDSVKIIINQLMSSPLRSLVILILSMMSGILEGLSIALLVPLLEIIISNSGETNSKYIFLHDSMEYLGISFSIGNILILFCIFIFLKSILSLIAMNYIGGVIADISYSMREKFLSGLFFSKWKYLNAKNSGELLNAINYEVPKASSVYRYSCVLLASLFQVIILFFVLYSFSATTMLGGIVLGLILFLSLHFYVRLASDQSKLQVNIMNKMISKVHEALNGIKVIKAMNLSSFVFPILSSQSEIIKIATKKQILAKHGLSYLREPIIIIFLSIGLYLVFEKTTVEVEIIFASLVLFLRLSSSIGKLQSDYQVFLVNSHYFFSFEEKLKSLLINKENKVKPINFDLKKGISFKNISFNYKNKKIFENLNLKLPSKGFVSITGVSGSGKTTLIDMLLKLHEPKAGNIFIGDFDYKSLSAESLRDAVGYVQQEPFIFNDSVFLNLTLGDKKISEERVIEALKKAHAYDFVINMHDGIYSNLGESGSKLSGGQKQRISLARALVRDPKILILDEATSALDKKTTLEILEILKVVSRSILVLAITHQDEVMSFSDFGYLLEDYQIKLIS